MENWFKDTGRPALFEALTEACDQLNSNFTADIQALVQDRTELASEVGSLRRATSKASHLENENRSLRLEIEELKKKRCLESQSKESPRPEDANRNIRTPLAPRSANSTTNSRRPDKPRRLDILKLNHPELKEEYSRLESNYKKLHERYLELEHAHAESTRLLRERTTVYHQWVDHAKQLDEKARSRSRKIKRLEARLVEVTQNPLASSFGSDPGSVRPVGQQQSEVFGQNNLKNSDEITIARPDQVSRTSPLSRVPLDIDGRARESSTYTNHVPTAKTHKSQRLEDRGSVPQTESQEGDENDDAHSLPPLPQDYESTGPQIFIKSEPSSDTPVVVSERSLRKRKHGDDKPEHIAASPKVKTEHSSDPLIFDERHHFTAQESIDFDDAVVGKIPTPRKRFQFFRVSTSRVLPDVSNTANERPASTDKSYDSRKGFAYLPEDCTGALSRNHTGTVPPESRSDSDHSSILCSRNIHEDGQAKSSASSASKQSKSLHISRGIAGLTEDDDHDDDIVSPTKKKSRTSATLQGLLDEPPPEPEVPSIPFGARSKDVPTRDLFRFELPQKRQLPFGKDGSKKANSALKDDGPNHKQTPIASDLQRNLGKATRKANVAKGGTPLRARSRSKLRLGDFKINPDANEGYDYAYTDVVRNKDKRATLQGCVDDTCCGPKFRGLARRSRGSTGTAAFRSLLEAYLGDECYKLSSMTELEKEEMWIEAKMRELANQYGTHRHRYHRMKTPPGFWRTGFPSTQEDEQDNQEAAKIEQQMIDERYREARRPGGRWIYRDE